MDQSNREPGSFEPGDVSLPQARPGSGLIKDLWKIVFSVLCGLLGAGLIWLVGSGPSGQPVELLPPPSPAPLTVHVAGAVVQPGVYHLPANSRVQDAVQAAGGLSPQADPDALNLAALLLDGSRIDVPSVSDAAPPEETEDASTGTATDIPRSPTPSPIFPIDINSASQIELERLPQIGPVRAARIVAYRQAHGPFEQIEDLLSVYDITPEVYAAIQDLIKAGNPEADNPPSPTLGTPSLQMP
jgi:competence protein ComEA